jgi:hypothetical protein
MRRTKTDEALERAERAAADDPERQEVLRRTRRFKASWIELAEVLAEVRRNSSWKRWGHDSFESYTRRELKLRAATVDKLLGSFAFLRKRAPSVLDRDGTTMPIPTYQSVDFLRRAYERGEAPEDMVEEIFHKVIDEAVPAGTLAREYGKTVFPISDTERKERDAAAVRNVAKRLRELLGETRAIPRSLAAEACEVLDRVLEAAQPEQQAA